MIEIITGVVLAASAGLNAYIPLLGLGLLSRFTEWVALPAGWTWIENEWCLGILGVLLIIEMFVDKVPALDSINDVLHTVIRPASGGMVFAAGAGSSTVAVSDPAAFISSAQVWPVVVGIGIALVPHVLKAVARPILNVLTAGAGAAISSTIEDIDAVVLTILAMVAPIIALVVLGVVIFMLVRRLRRALRERRERRLAAVQPAF
ncbi:DUF4126 domain-containing protein [Leucobacter sp. NPDC058333]|uniref:DUF4126 domain-containing protein n=1 Tax=Leucobacter sp. NPDC058333 TaxID=3346450 RepID=UPI0036511D7F